MPSIKDERGVNDVAICGLPHSGNRLLKRLAEHSGCQKAVVWHGIEDPPRVYSSAHVLVPVRCPRCRFKGDERRGRVHYDLEKLTLKVLTWVSVKRLPLMNVSYEALVRNPEALGRDIVEWLGLRWRGWPEEVVDGNAKYGCGTHGAPVVG